MPGWCLSGVGLRWGSSRPLLLPSSPSSMALSLSFPFLLFLTCPSWGFLCYWQCTERLRNCLVLLVSTKLGAIWIECPLRLMTFCCLVGKYHLLCQGVVDFVPYSRISLFGTTVDSQIPYIEDRHFTKLVVNSTCLKVVHWHVHSWCHCVFSFLVT